MDKNKIIQLISSCYDVLAKEYAVSKIGIFGSAVKGTMTEHSDLDIYVEFSHPIGFKFIEFAEYLEDLFGRKVDVLTKEGIKSIRVKKIAQEIERSVIYV
jgi:uncharacterized protein